MAPIETDFIVSETPKMTKQRTLTDMLTTCNNGIHRKFKQNSFFSKIPEKPKDFRNFEVKNGLVYFKKQENHLPCVLKMKIIIIAEMCVES